MSTPIDFSKPVFIEPSPDGESVNEAVKVQGSGLNHKFPYLILTQEGVYMTKSMTVSPSQARQLAERLKAFADRYEVKK